MHLICILTTVFQYVLECISNKFPDIILGPFTFFLIEEKGLNSSSVTGWLENKRKP